MAEPSSSGLPLSYSQLLQCYCALVYLVNKERLEEVEKSSKIREKGRVKYINIVVGRSAPLVYNRACIQ